ncbi:hypothetical protein CEXT_414401 [Caerostris extrusa]|uniref:Uncharacterized protein n=1 Tax=Caerostris extrusa TaxID=172846 RepID=A0AAV4NWF4_CAEEX|nr:hypothetical protein CEXT_414401 [Caerostris extrusa]
MLQTPWMCVFGNKHFPLLQYVRDRTGYVGTGICLGPDRQKRNFYTFPSPVAKHSLKVQNKCVWKDTQQKFSEEVHSTLEWSIQKPEQAFLSHLKSWEIPKFPFPRPHSFETILI